MKEDKDSDGRLRILEAEHQTEVKGLIDHAKKRSPLTESSSFSPLTVPQKISVQALCMHCYNTEPRLATHRDSERRRQCHLKYAVTTK